MSLFELVSSETMPLTAEMAKEFSAMQASPTERPINDRRVKHLLSKAEDDLLTPFGWSVAVVDGVKYRMNGQHSSNMLNSLNGNFPDGLKVHMDTYQVPSMEGLAMLFRQFDDRVSSRGPADVAGAYQGLQPALKDVDKHSAKMAVEGISWQRKNIVGLPTQDKDDRYGLFNELELHGFIIWSGELLSKKTPEMKRVPILSAMFATFDTNEQKAREFWELVSRGGEEYEDNDATTILSDWLLKALNGEFKIKPKPAEFYNASIYAWNAWRESREIKKINISKIKDNIEPSS